MAETDPVIIRIIASQKDLEKSLAASVRATERAAAKMDKALGGIGKAGGAGKVIPFKGAEDSIRKSTQAAGQLSFQLNDIATSLAGGASPFQVMMQQGSQVAQVMNGLRAQGLSMGSAIAGAFTSMLNPVSLLSFGLIALTGFAVQYFTASEDGSKKANKEAEAHLSALRALADAYKDILPALDTYVTKQERVVRAAKELETILAEQAKNAAEVDSAFSRLDAATALADLFVQIQQNAGAAAEVMQDQLLTALAEFQEAQATGVGVQEAWNKLVAKATALEEKYGAGSTKTAEALKAMATAIGANVDALEELEKVRKLVPEVVISLNDLVKALKEFAGVDPTGISTIIELLRTQFPDAIKTALDAIAGVGAQIGTQFEEVGKSIKSAADIIKQEEGFISGAKWDVNAFRVGFGSDTYVDNMGKVQKVTKDTVVTVEQATQDLNRRIGEFQATIAGQIGPEVWRSLAEGQQAALTSIAYNYGRLPASIVAAIKGGDHGQVAAAIAQLSANPARRQREAQLYAGAAGAGAGEPLKALETQREATKSLAEWNVETARRIELQKEITAINGQFWLSEAERAAQVEALRVAEEKLAELRRAGVTVTAEQEAAIRSLAQAEAEATVKSQEAADAQEKSIAAQKKATAEMAKVQQQFASIATSAISGFIQDLRNGVDAGEAFNNMLGKVIDSLINMAVQMAVAKAFGGAFGGLGGGGGGLFAAGGTVGMSRHSDGRKFHPAMWAGAPRFQKGGMVGLRPGEVPIIAHKGEVVIPRAKVTSGGGGGGTSSITNNVSIAVDASRMKSEVSAAGAVELGKQIDSAVQKVLVREQRNGGVLSGNPRGRR